MAYVFPHTLILFILLYLFFFFSVNISPLPSHLIPSHPQVLDEQITQLHPSPSLVYTVLYWKGYSGNKE